MPSTKIALIGAGSASFAAITIRDLTHVRELEGSTLVLNDVDGERLALAEQLARRVFEAADMRMKIVTSTTLEAVRDAAFVVLSVSKDRVATWEADFEIPRKHGIEHVLGENGGPGGLSHALRSVHLCVTICHEVAALAPDALVLNYTNPMTKVSLGIQKYTGLKTVGLCHQVIHGRDLLAQFLGLAPERVDVRVGGVNHFSWALAIEDTETGADLYPLLHERLRKDEQPDFHPLSKHMARLCGVWPLGGDPHIAEYVGYVHRSDFGLIDRYAIKTFNRGETQSYLDNQSARIREALASDAGTKRFLAEHSVEPADLIIRAILNREPLSLVNVNVLNEGCITNLPTECVVEVPGLVDGFGVHGQAVGVLPLVPAALCYTQALIQQLTVEAAVEGNPDKAIQALMIDPCVQNLDHAEAMLAEFLEVHRDYLPQFNT
ncbi:MAG: alpha-glucosidase/alpha-galactosidase [Nitrospiraceae bacterium]|nr:alpha-glucosidase/alpha-galactosidase [Nitrospiraceae bacterium]